jgi:steroid 5-alpha reductase family enzyme
VSLAALWFLGLASASLLMVVTWVASLVRQDASLVDRVWGLAFVVLGWTYFLAGDLRSTRAVLVVALVTVWGLRLSGYITWRNWGHGEDARYTAMRARRPADFARRSLVSVFLLQAVLAWLISVPLLAAIAVGPQQGRLGLLDLLGIGLFALGLFFETVGDAQLSRFLKDPANRGKVLDTGLWRFTRHPNYFGDTVVWWAFLSFAYAVGAWWATLGTLLMTYLIVKVSGVALTDRRMGRGGSSREGYADYVARTNAFFPGPRRRTPKGQGPSTAEV